MNIDKSRLVDTQGRPLTQSLFLEVNYDEKYAVYTLKDEDHTYNGKVYPSLKRLYLEMEDPIEYQFARKYLLGWNHWLRLQRNKITKKHIDEWRVELELHIASQGVREMMNLLGSDKGSFQAAKYLAERAWAKRRAGRPSKEEVERAAAVEAGLEDEFSADILRMENYRNKG